MNDLAITAAPKSAAARAWETRRANGWTPGASKGRSVHVPPRKMHETGPALQDLAKTALAAYELELAADMPDFHRVAILLKQALSATQPGTGLATRSYRPMGPKAPLALPPSNWHDYPVDRASNFGISNPTIVVTFADGEVVRSPAVTIRGKPLNIGRGIRVAIEFYRARVAHSANRSLRGFVCPVPAITACTCEDSGAVFDPVECTMRTIENRR